jgi:lipopolysaccharide/colanic/teichoic acid biosynthesis glycosyltransferase
MLSHGDIHHLPTQSVSNAPGIAVPAISALHPGARPRRQRIARATGGWLKRCADIVLASTALLVLLAPLAAIAAIVCIETRGPALFMQRRGGFRGRPFLIYKFRTMTTCDDGRAISQAVVEDARVTSFGGFLRKTSLDELPQLLNVLRGEMSLVGPRPHALAHDEAFTRVDASYRSRFRARPGMTGLAQVSGSRGLTATDEAVRTRVSFDNQYIDTWSPWLDLTIVFRTVFVVVLGDKRAF